MSDSSKIYDVPPEKQAILIDKAKRRLELRNFFLKQSSDPFRAEGGYIFDPALQRYQSLKVTEYERFKPNLKTAKWPFWFFLVPYAISTYVVYLDRTSKEEKYRRGEVAYKDRPNKFI
ncbi:hypothetical protein WA026_007427 [Henosepilachna vigintioctopunctata]|uniref:NADH dehydrogenase [ubiquinone] 1 beta subcomplex subunit 4 n=1 Tax=Henosepilachna vigintioctopunctata TaxID=420089 RepID=A0AAW1UUV8_9CUCU